MTRHLLIFMILLLIERGWSAQAWGQNWDLHDGYRSRGLSVVGEGKAGFTSLAPEETGVHFTNYLSQARYQTNQIFLNGSGVALGDVDGDGWCDIYLCGLERGNALFRNLGDWKFEDVTASAGVACSGQSSSGAVFADVDGDGDLDLLVSGIGSGVRLFLNDGKGHFQEATSEAGLGSKSGSTSMALADIDGDGNLDLYVANYRSHTLRDEPDTRFRVSTTNGQFNLIAVNGRSTTNSDLVGRFSVDPAIGVLENGEPDVLYRNDGHGKFIPLKWTDGTFLGSDDKPVEVPYDWGLSVMFHDLNEDGAPDIYVCNDFHSEDRIWINDGHGRFRAIAPLALRHTSLFSMGIDFADIDRDGHDDFLVADMLSRSHVRRQVQIADRKMLPPSIGALEDRPQYSRNMLFWNRGDNTYAEIAQLSGVEAADWCWCPVFLDVDLDGYDDILMVTGHERDAQNIDISRRIDARVKQGPISRLAQLQLRSAFPPYHTPIFAFRNRGDLTFEEVGKNWGFDSIGVSQGVALADLDNDGDLDLVVNCLNGPARLYRNNSSAARLAIRLRGVGGNTQGIGSKIRVIAGPMFQSQEVICGGRYLSGDDPMRTFAAPGSDHSARIEVTWRNGAKSNIPAAAPNRLYEIFEPNAPNVSLTSRANSPIWFEDNTRLLNHRHSETPYDDFQLQPLLPKRFSQGGPGITWFDCNNDGWDDLIVGSGRGGSLAAFLNNGAGGFISSTTTSSLKVTRDQTAILGWQFETNRALLLIGSANYEDGLSNGPAVLGFSFGNGSVDASLPGQPSSTGPLALADVDGKGKLDLFLGGQVLHGRYPEPASSLFFTSEQGRLVLDKDASKAFERVGIVNSAIWSDLAGKGYPDLILACEWAPIRIFRREGSGFIDVTRAFGLDKYPGWWQSVAVGDFDGDGKLDIVAGNWGRNHKYQSFLGESLHLFAGDLNGDGTCELIEAYFDSELKKVVPWRDWESLSRTMPFILDNFHSFAQFSTASVSEILGSRQSEMKDVRANTLDSILFLNRGDHFEAHPLPVEMQLAPVFGIAVADFDGDGNEDLFASQNFFAVPPSISRYDAGRGVLLKGDGRGSFQPISGDASGLLIYGEGRGAAVSDYDHDGRTDLAVGQNANSTRLFRNAIAKPGLRVRFSGPAGNPLGIGATARIEFQSGKYGPIREIHAGGGYWSEDSSVTVLGTPEPATAVWVRWPGGKTTKTPVPMGAKEVTAFSDLMGKEN